MTQQNDSKSIHQNGSKYKVVSLGDLHLGHQRLNIYKFIDKIHRIIFPHLKDIDILFIPGDFFDNLFTMSNSISIAIANLMRDFLELAIVNNFIIRVVRGTYLHDRNQNDFWEVLLPKLGTKNRDIDLIKVFNQISIENVLDLNIIYIPDGSPKNTMEIIHQLMDDRGLTEVDFVVGHGQFEHNIPNGAIVHGTIFNANDFKFVTGSVLFGHIHSFSVYKNVIYSNSFERFRHGEEQPKGFVKLEYDKFNRKTQFEFIENPEATIYKHINLMNVTDEEKALSKLNKLIESVIDKTQDTIYIQVTDNPIFKDSLRTITKKTYPNVFLSFKKLNSDNSENKLNSSNIESLELITQENLYSSIFEFIDGKLTLDEIIEIVEPL